MTKTISKILANPTVNFVVHVVCFAMLAEIAYLL